MLLCAALLLLSGVRLGAFFVRTAREQARFEALAASFDRTEAPRTEVGAAEDGQATIPPAERGETPPEGENAQRFAPLLAENPDFCGWLSIEGTNVDHPVMYTPEEPDRYLHLDFSGSESVSGTPYIGAGCTPESDNVLIYGHNMKNGTVFADLLQYADEEFFKAHGTVCFDTVGECGTYEIIAAFRERVHYADEEGVFRYYDYGGTLTQEAFEEYTAQISAHSLYDTCRSASYGDRLLTLSTCAYHVPNGRFVVVAVKRDAAK